jgi:hypothetical protein
VIALGSWTWISHQRLIHEQELDRQRIRARSEAEIALGEAEQLYESATAAPLLDLDDWRVAREAVTRAEALLQAGSLGPEMSQRVSNLSDMIMLGETERELVSGIDSARQEGIEASRYHLIENPGLEQKALITVMRESGLHPETCPDWEQASQQIRQYSEEVRDEVIGAMDQWLLHASEEQRTWLTGVLQNADQNPWRRAWRTVFVENNEAELARIFRSEEIAHQSSRSTLNASYSVRQFMPFEERLLVLQRLRVRHVHDVWINLRLGRVLLGEGRKQEALTYYQAALAAHPTAA